VSGDGAAEEYTYAYAAVSVADGTLDSLILPHVNGACMQLFLDEVCARHPDDRIVMVLDGAGWHQSASLSRADNLRLLTLPLYSPALNPVEHLWDDLARKVLSQPRLRQHRRARAPSVRLASQP
jgi:transposase